MKSLNIAFIGECMIELQKKQQQLQQTFGGDTLNTALYLSRLTKEHNINTSYVTALGQDSFSEDMLNNWQTEGINTDLVMRLKHKQPGLYYIDTDTSGERSFHYWRNDAAAKYLFDQPESDALISKLLAFDAIYLSGITLAILTENGRQVLYRLLAQYKKQGGQIIFDNNYRPKLWDNRSEAISCYSQMLKFTDIALLTFDDEQQLYGDTSVEQCIKRTSDAGVKEIIIKQGSQDCIVIEDASTHYITPLSVTNVVDTTAAGDSFSAGFLAKRFTGGNAQQAAFFGHCVAGTVIQHQGAIIPVDEMPKLSI